MEAGGKPTQFRIYDLRTGEALSEPAEHEPGPIDYCYFSNNDQYVVSTSLTEEGLSLWVWDPGNAMQLLHQASIPQSRLPRGFQMDMDPLCQRLAVAGGGGPRNTDERNRVAIVGDIDSGQLIALHHDRVVTNVKLSPSGSHALTDCLDGITRVWDAASGELVRAFQNSGDNQSPTQSQFSNDGQRIIVSRVSGDLQIWDVATGQALTPVLQRNSDPLGSTAPPGVTLFLIRNNSMTGLTDDAVDRCVIKDGESFLIYDISADTRPVEELVKMAQVLSGRKINALGNVETLPPQQWHAAWTASSESLSDGLLPVLTGELWHEQHIDQLNVGRVGSKGSNFGRTRRNETAASDYMHLWHLDQLIELRPDDVELYLQRGTLSGRMGDFDAAIADFDAAQLLGADVHRVRGNALAILERWEEAAADFEQMSSSNRGASNGRIGTGSGLLRLGLVYLSSGQMQKYDQLCERVTAADVSNPSIIRLTLLVPRDREYLDRLEEAIDSRPEGRNTRSSPALQEAVARSSAAFQEMLLYRRGDYEQVLAHESESDEEFQIPLLTVNSLLIRAMAHKQLEQDKQARELLQRATGILENASESSPWTVLQFAELLRREAEDLILN